MNIQVLQLYLNSNKAKINPFPYCPKFTQKMGGNIQYPPTHTPLTVKDYRMPLFSVNDLTNTSSQESLKNTTPLLQYFVSVTLYNVTMVTYQTNVFKLR